MKNEDDHEQIPDWKWLESRNHPWMKQMFLKGTKLRASIVYNEMVVNCLSITETADNFSITESAVNEAVQWCKLNSKLLEIEANKELVLVDNLTKPLENLTSQVTDTVEQSESPMTLKSGDWDRLIMKNMKRMNEDEAYRLEIAKKLS